MSVSPTSGPPGESLPIRIEILVETAGISGKDHHARHRMQHSCQMSVVFVGHFEFVPRISMIHISRADGIRWINIKESRRAVMVPDRFFSRLVLNNHPTPSLSEGRNVLWIIFPFVRISFAITRAPSETGHAVFFVGPLIQNLQCSGRSCVWPVLRDP